jgi:protein SCO1
MKSLSRKIGASGTLFTLAIVIFGVTDRLVAQVDHKWASDFPNITLRTHNDRAVQFYDLIKDKTVIINFMYTRCDGGICEPSTRNLVQVQKALGERLGKEVFIFSITLDPATDTPAVLKQYAELHGVKQGWTFLTGELDDINALRRKFGLANLDADLRNKLGLPQQSAAVDANPKRHAGMMLIRNDAFNREVKVSVTARPTEIEQVINRMKPPVKK